MAYRFQDPGPKKTRMGLNVKPELSLQNKLKVIGGPTKTIGTMQMGTMDSKTGKTTMAAKQPLQASEISSDEFYNGPKKFPNQGNRSFRGNSTQPPVKSAPKKPMWKSFGKTDVGGPGGKAKLLQAGGKF